MHLLFKTIIYTALAFVYISLSACSTQENIYNKSAEFWYKSLSENIARGQLDLADENYVSLASEHGRSVLTKSASLLLADAYMRDEQYIMANYYYDEYLDRFGDKKTSEYIEFLKIKSKMLSFKTRFREQYLIDEIIQDIDNLLVKYDDCSYRYDVLDYKARLLITRSLFNKEIADLYGRINKEKAQKYYQNKEKFDASIVTIQPRNWLRELIN